MTKVFHTLPDFAATTQIALLVVGVTLATFPACGDNAATTTTDAQRSPDANVIDAANISITFSEVREYRRLVDGFADLAACKLFQKQNPKEFFNCENWIQFCKNGGFTLVVTDIGNEGKYQRVSSTTITANVLGAGDLSGAVDFVLNTATDSLAAARLAGSNQWQRATLTAPESAQVEQGCTALEGRDWWQ
jgi:hypothetical protein